MVCCSSRAQNSHAGVLGSVFRVPRWMGSHVRVYNVPLDICSVAFLQLDRLWLSLPDPHGFDPGSSMPT